jgi:hypothetical protein
MFFATVFADFSATLVVYTVAVSIMAMTLK